MKITDMNTAETVLPIVHGDFVEVSHIANKVHFGHPVFVEAETYGVLVTRRSASEAHSLTTHENTRLLDLLIAAKEFMGGCDEEARQFEFWAIPSDARDHKARMVWISMEFKGGQYELTMTQL